MVRNLRSFRIGLSRVLCGVEVEREEWIESEGK